MAIKLGLAGDTMLGRGVAEELARAGPGRLFADELREVVAEADLFVVNLECCVSGRGRPVRVPGKPFYFRAPPLAARVLAGLGVDAVTLANNHALDFGPDALRDTRSLLADAGIRAVGAGADIDEARSPVILDRGGLRVGLLGVTDHPANFAARRDRPGVAYADLTRGVPPWLADRVRDLRERTDVALVSVHWGPNMVGSPVSHVRSAAPALLEAGATLVAGHSAHVLHGFTRRVLYDLGDFVDDYAVHPTLRNDLGAVFLVSVDGSGPLRVEIVPLALDYCRTRLADPAEYAWVADRLGAACARMGTELRDEGDRLCADWAPDRTAARRRGTPDDGPAGR